MIRQKQHETRRKDFGNYVSVFGAPSVLRTVEDFCDSQRSWMWFFCRIVGNTVKEYPSVYRTPSFRKACEVFAIHGEIIDVGSPAIRILEHTSRTLHRKIAQKHIE